MGDIADDLTDEGWLSWELHVNGECNPTECQYCMEEHWDADTRESTHE